MIFPLFQRETVGSPVMENQDIVQNFAGLEKLAVEKTGQITGQTTNVLTQLTLAIAYIVALQ